MADIHNIHNHMCILVYACFFPQRGCGGTFQNQAVEETQTSIQDTLRVKPSIILSAHLKGLNTFCYLRPLINMSD